MLLTVLALLLSTTVLVGQVSLGTIQTNTNTALPSAYNFQEYVFAEPDDQGICDGSTNTSANITEVFLCQTHRQAVGHPLFFTIGHRPAVLQVAVQGTGAAPDVQVEGRIDGVSLGVFCLAGPAALSPDIDLGRASFADYFSVTLPKSWVRPGLSLSITAGDDNRTLSEQVLKIGPYTELNLVMVNMDVLDYNEDDPFETIFPDFLQEVASAIPASIVRFGQFPGTLRFPELIASNNTEELVRLSNTEELAENGIDNEGHINSVMSLQLANMQKATGDYLSTIYFGNTLNLAPGGWGGDRSFVGFDYTDIFIHELGHALSLPHWGEHYDVPITSPDDYLYPYGGETGEGGGRGNAWNFIQDTYEFVDPICKDADLPHFGFERSDCMQREHACYEKRSQGFGPWDGFGDFSAIAMHRFLVGAQEQAGQVNYQDQTANYQLGYQDGYPTLALVDGQRMHFRDPLQPAGTYPEDAVRLPGQELSEQEVYLIYGTAHQTQDQANIVYEPIKYTGTLPPLIDPTDPETFAILQELNSNEAMPLYAQTRDIILRLTYTDGSIRHALVPQHSFARATPDFTDFGIWREDVCNFAVVVPGDNDLCEVELFHRPFTISDVDDDTEGNINFAPHNITPLNFMEAATTKASFMVCEVSNTAVVENAASFSIYPNPVREDFSIEIPDYHNRQLTIFNARGQEVFQAYLTAEKSTITMADYPSGVYMLRVNDSARQTYDAVKLIKQ